MKFTFRSCALGNVLRRSSALLALLVAATGANLEMPARSEIIPAERLTNWTPGTYVGVRGGIPINRTQVIDVTQAPYNADRTGSTSALDALQRAINAANQGDVVYLPAGKYLIENTLQIGSAKDNITLRGAGMNLTIIDCRSPNTGISVGSGSDYRMDWPPSGNTISAGVLGKGSENLPIENTAAFSVGQLVRVTFDDQHDIAEIRAGAVPVINVGAWKGTRGQITRITGVNSNGISISPGIYQAVDKNLGARVNAIQAQTDGVGIENLTIDSSNGQTSMPIAFEQCNGCWIKDVKSIRTKNYHMYMYNSLNCEVRRCVLDSRQTEGSNGAGLLVNSTSGSLFEDNIVLRMFPAVEVNAGSSGNVFAFNVFEDSRVFGGLGVCIDTNHGPHNSFNLYEGNVSPNFQADGYFGSVSEDVLFRNWFHGTVRDRSINGFMTSFNRFARKYTFVANILGTIGTANTTPYSFGNPNMGNAVFTGTAKPSEGQFWRDWDALLSASPGQGPGSNGFQESDLDVESTTLLKANYHFAAGQIPENQRVETSIPVSLFRQAKPKWFGDCPWPPFDPLNVNMPDYDRIPAGFRFIHGSEPTGTDATSPGSPINVRVVPK